MYNWQFSFKTTFTLFRVGLKTVQKSVKTELRLHRTGADLFQNVTFAAAKRPHFSLSGVLFSSFLRPMTGDINMKQCVHKKWRNFPETTYEC